MNARAMRVKRLRVASEVKLTTRERELSDARRLVEERDSQVEIGKQAIEDACAREEEVVTAEDLAMADAHRQALTRRVQLLREAAEQARVLLGEREVAAVEARKDEKRLEILQDGLEATDAARRTKLERKQADEHAARMGNRS